MNLNFLPSGLSAVYPGMVDMQQNLNRNDMSDLQLQQQRIDMAGRQAAGNYIASIVPAAAPGMPMQPPQAPPLPQAPGPLPVAPGPTSAAPAAPGPAAVPPVAGPGTPGAPSQVQQRFGPFAGPQPPAGMQQGPKDWRQIAAEVARANPGAPPEVIMSAVTNLMPLMTSQAQQEWRLMQMQLQEERLRGAETRSLRTDARVRTGQDLTHDDRQARENRLSNQFQQRETRLAQQFIEQQGYRDRALQQRVDDAQRKAEASRSKQDLAAWRAAVNARFQYHKQRSSNAANIADPKQRAELNKQLDDMWTEELEHVKRLERGSTLEDTNRGDRTQPAEPPNPQSPPAARPRSRLNPDGTLTPLTE